MPRKTRKQMNQAAKKVRGRHTERECVDTQCPIHNPSARRD